MKPASLHSPNPQCERPPSLRHSGNLARSLTLPTERAFLFLSGGASRSPARHGESGADRCQPEDAKSLSPPQCINVSFGSMRIE